MDGQIVQEPFLDRTHVNVQFPQEAFLDIKGMDVQTDKKPVTANTVRIVGVVQEPVLHKN